MEGGRPAPNHEPRSKVQWQEAIRQGRARETDGDDGGLLSQDEEDDYSDALPCKSCVDSRYIDISHLIEPASEGALLKQEHEPWRKKRREIKETLQELESQLRHDKILELLKELDSERDKIRNLESKLESKSKTIKRKDKKIAELRKKLEWENEHIEELTKELDEKNEYLDSIPELETHLLYMSERGWGYDKDKQQWVHDGSE